MSGALAVRDDQQDWTEVQKAALAQLGVAEAPRGDQLVFLHVSQRMNLDPFNKEIYMIGRWDPEAGKKKWAIQVGIDGFRSKSEEHPQFAGVGNVEWCGPDGAWTDVWLVEQPPTAARFTVYRKDQDKPIRAVAIYREYVQTKKDGNPTQRWRNAAAAQLGKCAEALTRRTAFPRQLGGVYVPEELDHLDNPQPPPVVIEAEVVPAEPDWDALIRQHEFALDRDELAAVWTLARGLRPNDAALAERIAQAGERVKATLKERAAETAATKDKNRLFALLRDGAVSDRDREVRLRVVNRLLNRPPLDPITSFGQLTAEEVATVNAFLQRAKDDGHLTHTLADLGAPAPDAAPAPDDEGA